MKRILIAEDNVSVREALATVLRDAGYEVVEVKDGNETVRAMRSQPADLVLCDVLMPDKDGLETIIDLRREYPNVKIIAISGGGRKGNVEMLTAVTCRHSSDHRSLENGSLGIG